MTKRILLLAILIATFAPFRESHAESSPSARTAEELYQSGDFEAALVRLRAAIAENANDSKAYLLLGLVELRRNDPAAAAAAWARYEELAKDPRAAQEIGKMRTIVAREAAERAARQALDREKQIGGEGGSPRTVAVATFQNAGSAQYANLGKALAAMLIDNLTAVPGVTVLEREQVEALEKEAKLSGTGLAEKGTAVRAGRLLRAGRVAAGSHADTTATPAELRLDALLVDVSASKTVTEGKSEALANEFYKLIPAVATKFATELGTEPSQLPPAAKAKLTEEHTRSLAAAVAFGKALDGLDRHDVQSALEACKVAQREDPNFRLAKKKCGFIPAVWLSNQGIVSAVEPTALGTTTTAAAAAGAGGVPIWVPVAGALAAGGIAGGTYAAVSNGGGHGSGSNGGGTGGNAAPALSGVADRTVTAGQTAALELSCRDPEGTASTITNPQKGPGATFTETSGDPATALYQQPTNVNQVGQNFTAGFTCTDSGSPAASVQLSATIHVVSSGAEPTPTPGGKVEPTPVPVVSTPTPVPTPVSCKVLGNTCSSSFECCSSNCGVTPQSPNACCVPPQGSCTSTPDCCLLGADSTCIAGSCCVGFGAKCTSNADCCSNSCNSSSLVCQ